jgi:release factor glutamine methyltransferase
MPITVAAALAKAQAAGLERRDGQLLLGFVLQQPRAWLIAHDTDGLSAGQAGLFGALCARRAGGEPLAYLTGEREFHGLRLQVSPAVLDPRPDTETLVDWALELLPENTTALIADLGTGSGAIALALKNRRPTARLCAVDLSPSALAVAANNGERLGLAVEWCEGSWWQPLTGRHFDLVASNPPYIAGADPHLTALHHEPQLALTPGGDGLDALRAIVAGAPGHLVPGGWLLLEHGWDQADAVTALFRGAGFGAPQTHRDLAGQPRCTGARWMPP